MQNGFHLTERKVKRKEAQEKEEGEVEGRMDGDGEKGASVVIFHHNPVTVE